MRKSLVGCRPALFAFTLLFLIGCGIQRTTPKTQGDIPQDKAQSYAVYIGDDPFAIGGAAPGTIAAYHISADGIAEAVQGSPFGGPSGPLQFMVSAGFLFVDSVDYYNYDTGELGPARGIYLLHIASDGALTPGTRLTQTIFPASISNSGSSLYVSEADRELSGHPIQLKTYSVDPVSGLLTLQPNSTITIDGDETASGDMTATLTGFWVRSNPRTSTETAFLHFQTDPSSGAPLPASRISTPGGPKLFANALAGSEHFLLVSDHDRALYYTVQNGVVVEVQGCHVPAPECNFGRVVINPSERFALLLSANSIGIVPLDPTVGLRFDLARRVDLTLPHAVVSYSAMALSSDGKVVAVARDQQLDLFTVAPDGSLRPVAGSPFQMPISHPGVMTIAELPQN